MNKEEIRKEFFKLRIRGIQIINVEKSYLLNLVMKFVKEHFKDGTAN
jgi:hypothetical protein